MNEGVNNLGYWFPKIEKAGLPVPDTRIVTTGLELESLLDGNLSRDDFEDFVRLLAQAADEVGGFPCFLRTGYGSGKHEWRDTCYVESREDLGQHVVNLVEWSACAGIMGLPTDTWVVRRLIPNVPLFNMSAYGDMPFVLEWRLFARHENDVANVEHIQPYWPLDAIEQGSPDTHRWRDILNLYQRRLDLEPRAVLEQLGPMAMRAADACGGFWSVDFLWSSVTCSWWLTDMADGDRSFRYEP